MYKDEVWAQIAIAPRYEVSTYGRVINTKSGCFLTPYPNTRGYPKVSMRADGRSITRSLHRLVAETFMGGPHPGLEPNHKDGDKFNSHVSNLEWVTHKENMEHASIHKLFINHRGSRHVPIRIVETDERFESILKCALSVGISSQTIRKYLDRPVTYNGHTFERLNRKEV